MHPTTADRLVIGVDGGGSKTEAVLGVIRQPGADPEIIATAHGGPSNLQREPFSESLDQVERACSELLEKCPSARGRVGAACLPWPAAATIHSVSAFREWAVERGWAPRVIVTHDARPLIARGTDADCGIAVIAGTGSFAYSRTVEGRESYCGGWGRVVGDEGSAHWLAVEGLRHALYACDGRGPETRLLGDFGEWFGGDSPAAWPRRIAAMQANELAAAARLVTTAADAGDAVAGQLVSTCAEHLARLVATLYRQHFAAQGGVELAVAGGLLCGSPLVYQGLLAHLAPQAHITRVQHVPASVARRGAAGGAAGGEGASADHLPQRFGVDRLADKTHAAIEKGHLGAMVMIGRNRAGGGVFFGTGQIDS